MSRGGALRPGGRPALGARPDPLLALVAGEVGGGQGRQLAEVGGQRRAGAAQQRLGGGDRPGAPSRSIATMRSTSPSRSSTARLTSPISAARAAPTVSPVRKSSCASRGRSRGSTVAETTAGTTPRRTSGNANVTSGAASTMSHAATIPIPPPRTAPASRATTGTDAVHRVSRTRGSAATAWSPAPAPPASRRSIPAQKAGPVWVSRTTRVASRPSAASRCPASSRSRRAESALRLAGESRVTVATPSATSRCTSSSITPHRPRPGPAGSAAPRPSRPRRPGAPAAPGPFRRRAR